MRAEAEVVVVGLGALGAAAVASLAERGLEVIGLDRHRPPHELGSSHGGSRIIRRIYSEGSLYVPLVDRAYGEWRDLERRAGERLLLPGGGLFLGARDGAMVREALACARERGLEHELLDAGEIRRRFPHFDPPAGVEAVFDPAAGVLLAERCQEALLARATGAGAELWFDRPMTGWRAGDDGARVEIAGGEVRARSVVLATGGWLADAAAGPEVRLSVERQVQHWFEPHAGAYVSDLPPFVWELEGGRSWYGLPDLGEGLKVGMHHGGEPTTAESLRREVDPAESREMRRLLEQYLPGTADRCLRSRACMYANTPDLRFLAGPIPGRPGAWVLGGGSGHGFKFAPALGDLVARGVVEGRPPRELAPFLPRRFAAA